MSIKTNNRDCSSSSFLFLTLAAVLSSCFLLMPKGSYAYAEEDSKISVTFDSNPRISSIVIDGVIYLPSQQPVTLSWKDDASIHTFSIPEASVYESAGKKYAFQTWNDLDRTIARTIKASTENDNSHFMALFETQYLLTVLSDYGSPKGAGWYGLGEIAAVEMDAVVNLSADTRMAFSGWSGGHLPNSVKNYVEINNPTVIVANWKEQFNLRVETNTDGQDESVNGGATVAGHVAAGSGWHDKGSVARVSVPEEIELLENGQKIKFAFKEWTSSDLHGPQISDVMSSTATLMVDSPYVLSAQWESIYYVEIDSNYGNPSGEGYYKPDAVVNISVEPVHDIEPGKTRLIFSGWQEVDNSNKGDSSPSLTEGDIVSSNNAFQYTIMNEPKVFKPIWTKQYSVQVQSAYGIIEGTGWYSEGSSAVLSIMQPSVNLAFGKTAIFEGWSTDSLSGSTSSGAPLTYLISNVDRPYEVSAAWQVDETPRFIVIMAALSVTGALILSIAIASRKKIKKNKNRLARNEYRLHRKFSSKRIHQQLT